MKWADQMPHMHTQTELIIMREISVYYKSTIVPDKCIKILESFVWFEIEIETDDSV